MTTIIKLVLAFALLTAAFQGSRALMSNYQFEDEMEQTMLFSPNASDAELVQKVMALAVVYDLPIEEDDIAISMHSSDRVVDVTYTAKVPFIPGLITQPITFKPSASVRLLTAPHR